MSIKREGVMNCLKLKFEMKRYNVSEFTLKHYEDSLLFWGFNLETLSDHKRELEGPDNT